MMAIQNQSSSYFDLAIESTFFHDMLRLQLWLGFLKQREDIQVDGYVYCGNIRALSQTGQKAKTTVMQAKKQSANAGTRIFAVLLIFTSVTAMIAIVP